MSRFMKKLGLTVAFGVVMAVQALAQTRDDHKGVFQVEIRDFITINPGGSSSFSTLNVNFKNPVEMNNGITIGPQIYTVSASRSWKAKVSASDFQRVGGKSQNPNVVESFSAAASLKIKSNFLTTAPAGTILTAYDYTPVGSSGVVIAQSSRGGNNVKFELTAKIVPGAIKKLSGDYASDVTVIAALD